MTKDDDPSYVLALGIVIPILCMGFVTLRFYTRRRQHAALKADDWLTIPALILVVSCGACLIAGVALRVMGYPTPPLDDPSQPETSSNYNIRTISKLEWAIMMMQIAALGLTKLSFIFFYRRIFVTGQSKRTCFGVVTILAMALILSWTIAYLCAELFVCKGHWAAEWTNLHTLTTQCIKTTKSLLSLAITDFLTDVIVLVLPISEVFKLRMSMQRRFAVLGVFALGTVAVAVSATRMGIFIWGNKASFTDKDLDNNLLVTRVLFWSVLEAGLALVACCLPTVKPSLQTALDGIIKRVPSYSSSISSLMARGSHSDGSRQVALGKGSTTKETFHTDDREKSSFQWGVVTTLPRRGTGDTGDTGASIPVPGRAIVVDRSFEVRGEGV